MKILLMGDNHGLTGKMHELVDKYREEMDYIIHTGDSELSVKDPIWEKIDAVVVGNMDFFEPFEKEIVLDTSEGNIYVFHGHYQNVRFGLQRAHAEGVRVGANLVLFGHTHCLLAEMHDGILYVNPGSLSSPRCGIAERTYAIIEITSKYFKVDFYDEHDNYLERYSKIFVRE